MTTPRRLHLIRTEKGLELRLEDDRADKHCLSSSTRKEPRVEIGEKGALKITDSGQWCIPDRPRQGRRPAHRHKGGEIEMSDTGVTLKHGATTIALTSAGITLTGGLLKLDGDSVALGKGASVPLVNGTALVASFASHVHPTPVGPSGPPPVPISNVSAHQGHGF